MRCLFLLMKQFGGQGPLPFGRSTVVEGKHRRLQERVGLSHLEAGVHGSQDSRLKRRSMPHGPRCRQKDPSIPDYGGPLGGSQQTLMVPKTLYQPGREKLGQQQVTEGAKRSLTFSKITRQGGTKYFSEFQGAPVSFPHF